MNFWVTTKKGPLSIRGEGDLNSDRKLPSSSTRNQPTESAVTVGTNNSSSSPTSSNSNGTVKVERKESTRLASGASKFLRSLRNVGHKEINEHANSIALKELKHKDQERSHLPERSLSFQEKRFTVGTNNLKIRSCESSPNSAASGNNNNSGIGIETYSNEPVKVKHLRTQSFLCTTSSHPGLNNLNCQPSISKFQLLETKRDSSVSNNIPPSNNVSLCPDPVNHIYSTVGRNSTKNITSSSSYETIYENLEVIRQQNQQSGNKYQRPPLRGKSSSSSSLKNLSLGSPSPPYSTSVSPSIRASASFSSTGNIMTIFEKEKERRIPSTRTLSRETCCYEINYSDYMNIDKDGKDTKSLQKEKITNPTICSANGKSESQESSKNELSHYSVPLSPVPLLDKASLGEISSSSPGSVVPTPTNDTQQRKPNGTTEILSGISGNNGNGRKLRRSISEVEPIALSKLQSKVIDTSKTIYSSVSNGLSIWAFQKSGRHLRSNSSSFKTTGKDSPYPIYGRNLSSPGTGILYEKCGGGSSLTRQQQTQPVLSSTLPRSSNHHHEKQQQPKHHSTTIKASASLRKDLDAPLRANNLSKIHHCKSNSTNGLFPSSRSTPNLKDDHLKVYCHPPQKPATPTVLNNLNKHIYHSQSQILEQKLQQQQSAGTNSNSIAKLYQNYYSVSRNRIRPNQVPTPPPDTSKISTQLNSLSAPSSSYPSNGSSGPDEHLYENSTACTNNRKSVQDSSSSSSSKEESENSSNCNTKMSNGGSTNTSSWMKQPESSHNGTMNSSSPNSCPPVRDSASIKQVRYGPGHEKYPSWPVSANTAAAIDPAGELNSKMLPGSSRSKSWTEQTDYPKEKVPSYARPYMKRMNQTYTQQLKTVVEKSERMLSENSEKLSRSQRQNGTRKNSASTAAIGVPIVPPPLGYRDMYKNGDEKEYNIPSPPERDGSVGKALTEEDLELYAKKYEERMSHYAQSEGYHSYISSECSSYISSGTPFLDQLRRESESNEEFWCGDNACDPNDPLFGVNGHLSMAGASGRESVTTVVTNSSGSSGTETLKWQGSNGDLTCNSNSNCSNHNGSSVSSNSSSTVSNASCSSGGSRSNMWEQNIAHSAKVTSPKKIHPDSILLHNGIQHVKSNLESGAQPQQLSPMKHDTRNLRKFPLNTYTRPNALGLNRSSEKKRQSSQSQEQVSKNHLSCVPDKKCNKPISTTHSETLSKPTVSPPSIDTSKPPSVAERILELEQQQQKHQVQSLTCLKTTQPIHHLSSGNMTMSSSNVKDTSLSAGETTNDLSSSCSFADKFVKSSSLGNLTTSSSKAQPQHPSLVNCHLSLKTNGVLDPYPDSTNCNNKTPSPASLGYHNLWLPSSENNLLRSLEHQSPSINGNSNSPSLVTNSAAAASPSIPVSYTYLDPEKKHKVADMTLKAIQKKALLAYYERHTGKSVASPTNDHSPTTSQSPLSHLSSGSSSNSSSGFSEYTGTGKSSSDNNTLERDSPFPPRLALSLPRDIDPPTFVAAKKHSSSSHSASSSPAINRQHPQPSPQENMSSHIGIRGTNVTPASTAGNGFGRNSTGNSNLQVSSASSAAASEESTESARMAYMSKYLPHLNNHDRDAINGVVTNNASWNEVGSNSADGVRGALPENPTVVPNPPERPPKKPHLRNIPQQSIEEDKEKPPPPLPRAPVRPANSSNTVNKSSSSNSNGLPPPLPSKPQPQLSLPPLPLTKTANLSVKRCSTPDFPLPPPPPLVPDEQVAAINDDDFPPPPTPNEVCTAMGPKSRSISSGLGSYLHKDSYLAQRKERSLGYEGRYRRTLSPSGLGTNSGEGNEQQRQPPGAMMSTATSTDKIDATVISPAAAWEKYHNIGAPSTTVIFSSHEIAKSQQIQQQPTFHRSISCDNNLFNNKTGFSQSHPSVIAPPVAQVAPLRGIPSSDMKRTADSTEHLNSNSNIDRFESCKSFNLNGTREPATQPESRTPVKEGSSSLRQKGQHLETGHHNNNQNGLSCNGTGTSNSNATKKPVTAMTETERVSNGNSGNLTQSDSSSCTVPQQSVMVMVSPLRFESESSLNNESTSKICSPIRENKENIHFITSNNNSNESSSNNKSSWIKNNKSEVSFRVSCTSDAYSQTESSGNEDDKDEDDSALPTEANSLSLTLSSTSSSVSSSCNDVTATTTTITKCGLNSPSPTTSLSSYKGRQKSQEELECEELSRDLAKQLPQGDKLQSLLVPLPESKTTADYMEGLFHIELNMRPDHIESQYCERNLSSSPSTSSASSSTSSSSSPVTKNKCCSISPEVTESCSSPYSSSSLPCTQLKSSASVNTNRKYNGDDAGTTKMSHSHESCNGGHAPLPADSAYFTTSESKAKFLTQYVKDMRSNEASFRSTDSQELIKQKEELVSRISRKLDILRTAHAEIREEIQSNEMLGQVVIERVKETAKRNEFDKFKLHVEEIEKITSLLLGLSGRLARAENALMSLIECPNPQEKKILESKRDKLKEQLDEAKTLKESIDRRSAQVSGFLVKYLSPEEYADYHHFTKMKAKLIIDSREIDDKIKLGEEQLLALQETLSFGSSSGSSSSCSTASSASGSS